MANAPKRGSGRWKIPKNQLSLALRDLFNVGVSRKIKLGVRVYVTVSEYKGQARLFLNRQDSKKKEGIYLTSPNYALFLLNKDNILMAIKDVKHAVGDKVARFTGGGRAAEIYNYNRQVYVGIHEFVVQGDQMVKSSELGIELKESKWYRFIQHSEEIARTNGQLKHENIKL